MKNVLSIILIILSSLFSSYAQEKETRDMESFNKISVLGNFHVILEEGNENRAVIKSDDLELENIITEVESNMLKIRTRTEFRKYREIVVYVTYKHVRKISSSAGAKVTGESVLKSEFLDISASAGGFVELEVLCDELELGSGQGSECKISGKVSTLDCSTNTGGIIDARELTSQTCYARSNTGGIANVYVTHKLKANANTGGIVNYKGNPGEVAVNTSIGGSVSKMN